MSVNRVETENQPGPSSGLKKVIAVLAEILCVLYAASPVDLAPDVIPVVGWMDDLMINIAGLLNLFQVFASNAHPFLIKLVKYLKWFILLCAVGVALIFGGLISIIILLINK